MEGLGRHNRLLSATSLLNNFDFLGQLGGDFGRRWCGLDGHHLGLAAFFANTHSIALELWRRLERHHLCPLPDTAHTRRSKVGSATLIMKEYMDLEERVGEVWLDM